MESFSSNIDIRNGFFFHPHWVQSHTTVLLIINQKELRFLVFTSCHNFRLILCFCLSFKKFSFKLLEKILEILKLISSSEGKLLWYLPRFYQELFHSQIHYKHHLFHLYSFIFQKNLKFLHIQTGHYIYIYFKRTVMFLLTTILIKLCHLLHSLAAFSYFCFYISYLSVYHAKYFTHHSIETQNHL